MESGFSSGGGGGVTSGSSALFTEEEIASELEQMGLSLSPSQLSALKKELEEMAAAEGQLSSGAESSRARERTEETAPGLPASLAASAPLLRSAADLLRQADQRLAPDPQRDELLERIDSLSARVAAAAHDPWPPRPQPDRPSPPPPPSADSAALTSAERRLKLDEALREAKTEAEVRALGALQRHLKQSGVPRPRQARETGTVVEVEMAAVEVWGFVEEWVREERRLRADPLARPTFRPVVHFANGRLPFRSDPVQRFHLYKAEWEKKPEPGSQRRQDLRWRVREYMMRQDLPQRL